MTWENHRRVFKTRDEASTFYANLDMPRKCKFIYVNCHGYYTVAWCVQVM